MKELVLATSNPGKIAELTALLAPLHCIPQNNLQIKTPEENGLSFIENAILKARYAATLANKAALADDSGLVVEVLNGEPGIYSARYAGEDASDAQNIALLLEKLKNIPDEKCQAFFYCALALVRYPKDPVPLIATGKWEGRIIKNPQGVQGFGYDPVFFIEDKQCTAAELPAELKNKLSHRGQALAKMRKLLPL